MRSTALSLVLAATSAAPLCAQEAFTWVYHADFALFPSDSRLNLVATQAPLRPAGPDSELPGGLIWGSCLTELDSGDIALRFEAFAGAAQAGDMVTFTLSGSSGGTFTTTAQIIDRGNDPVGGAEILVSAGGPEMQMLATSDVVTYGVVGLDDFIMDFDLSANRAYVAEFDAQCGALAAGGTLQRGPDLPSTGVVGALTPDVGPNISGHTWTRFTDLRDDVFETTLAVTYGVPETDDVLIQGQCFNGAQGPLVAMQFAADIDGLAENDLATLRIRNGAGQEIEVDGSVVGTAIEFGVSGVELVLQMSDPAWLVIAGDPTVQVARMGASGGFTFTGNGPNTLGPFLADCDQIDTLTPESGTHPSAPIGAQEGYLSCDNLGRVGSRDTGQPTAVTFSNESGAFRALLWLDPDGTPVNQAGLNPGETVSFTTDPGHVWMATDGPGNCREMIQPVPGQASYRLTVM